MKDYKVIREHRQGRDVYAEGSTRTLSDDDAAPLLAAGLVEPG